jgi:hypothetical protein
MVYWMQRKRFWTLARKLEVLAGGCPANVPTLGQALQDKLHHRAFRMRRPGLWERQRLGLEEHGNRVPAGSEGVLPGQDEAAPGQPTGSPDGTRTTGGLRSILAAVLAKILGGG